MIVRARHNFIIYNFFKIYTLVKIRWNFKEVHFIGDTCERNLPVLFISNHISWWDGFWVMYMNMKKFHRKLNFMMLEEQLDKHRFFKKTGGFSVKKGSRSIIETIGHARELLTDRNNLLLIFPQGEIQSIYKTDFSFEKGIERILKGNYGKIQVILNANLIDFLSDQKPSLYMYIRDYRKEEYSLSAIEKEYNDFYSACLADQTGKESKE